MNVRCSQTMPHCPAQRTKARDFWVCGFVVCPRAKVENSMLASSNFQQSDAIERELDKRGRRAGKNNKKRAHKTSDLQNDLQGIERQVHAIRAPGEALKPNIAAVEADRSASSSVRKSPTIRAWCGYRTVAAECPARNSSQRSEKETA